MSFATRNALRRVVRPNTFSRRYASHPPAEVLDVQPSAEGLAKFLNSDKALTHHAAQASDLWRKISYYVCVPAVAVCVLWVYNLETEHAAHIAHIKQENGGELPPEPAYEYMNRRIKPFPWGANSLFFNAHVNKNMEEAA